MMPSFIRMIAVAILAVSAFAFTSCGGSSQSTPTPSYQTPRIAYKPRITIRNNSYKDIVLGLKGPETRFISIPARSSKSVNLYSGTYKYAATAKNTNTISGYKYFGTDRRYTWNFSVN